MNYEIIAVIITFLITIIIAMPLGKYISKVFKDEKVFTDFIAPIERFIFRISGIKPNEPMDWKQNLKAMVLLNLVFFLWAFVLLLLQQWHFWNPAHIGNMEPTLAFNTAASFVSNTNIQHYSGETGASHFSQLLIFVFLHFVSAATGIAALALLFKGLVQKQATDLGNFYNLFLKTCTRILLPIASVIAILLLLNGSPVTFNGAQNVHTLEGKLIKAATGPIAPMIAIKQLGTNGGGFFGANSAHPFENPNYITNMIEVISELIIAIGLVFAFGYYSGKKKLAYTIFSAMAFFFIIFVSLNIKLESVGNPLINKLGIYQANASNMEGKEVRFGAPASSYFSIVTTSTSCGAVNSAHDSFMPLSGGLLITDMMINAIFGGVGVGFLNFFVFLIIAVFISGLMVGRTPEFLGKKIEAREVKIAILIALLHPLLILTGTGISSFIAAHNPETGWFTNPGYHGFSEMLYEFSSASANNGSEFAGLSANTPFWNIFDGLIMLFSRFLPIIGPVAIAGFIAQKKYIPESAGTLKTEGMTFGIVIIAVILIIAALSFFPALALGPVAEHFLL
jgi:potassium-transporting ATPase potassium-binding subunit